MGPKKQTTKTTQRTHEETASEAAAIWVERTALHAWDKNPRKNEKAIPKVMESIKRFGFGSPILARKNGEIIAGHTRWAAAEALGLDRVPVRYLDLDPAEAHLLALADNKLGEVADWDTAALLGELGQHGLDAADVAGFDQAELDRLGSLLDKSGHVDKLAEWEDMPNFENEDTCCRKIIVSFEKPGDAYAFAIAIGQEITDSTKSVWYPAKEKRVLKDKEWV